jgi:uncharacterized caspase-like protein
LQDRMHRLLKTLLPVLAILAVVSSPPAGAAPSEKRLALVIGNASYKAKPLATAVNDAALIAQTLQAAGFDVMGARDLDEDALRRTFRDFIDSVTKAGPDATAAVYFAGYGLQLEGENYLVPTEADIVEASDVPLRAVQLSELTQALAALHLKTTFMILDVARASPFVLSGQPPAGGLAWVEPETNMLIAFNAAPGTVSPDGADGYGPYAKALAEMIREGGLTPVNLFDRVRLRVNELTKGAQVPWDASKIETQFMFLERGPGAPPRADSPEHTAWMRSQPMRSLGAHDAYMVALARDTFDAYADFLADYWHDPMTNRVRALLAARREAITWRRTCQSNAPDAYLSYLERYPRGPHVADARRLLAREGATIAPPSRFEMLQYEVPPPLPDELEHIERTVLVLDDPAFAFEPPPPSPVYFLEPPPPELLALVPPAAPFGAYILPAPKFVPLPSYVGVPVDVVAPPHPPGVAGDASNLAARLPPSVAPKAALIDSRSPPPPTVNPVASEEIKAPLSPPLPTVPSAPLRPTDNEMTASRDIEPPAPTTNDEPPISVPATLAPPPTGMSRRAATPSRRATGGIPLPVPRPVTVTLEPPLTGTPLPTPGAVMPSPEATGSIPLPTPRPVAFAPPPTRNRQKPIAHTLSTSSPREVNPTEQRTVPLLNWLTYLGRPPKVTPEVSPPKPRGKPCAVVNGRLVCG